MESKCPDETLCIRGMNIKVCVRHMFEEPFHLVPPKLSTCICTVRESHVESFNLCYSFNNSFNATSNIIIFEATHYLYFHLQYSSVPILI